MIHSLNTSVVYDVFLHTWRLFTFSLLKFFAERMATCACIVIVAIALCFLYLKKLPLKRLNN